MGIKDLISKVFPDDLKVESSFEVLKDKTMGVDVSNYLFKLVTMRDNLVRDFHCQPRLDVSSHIYKFWDLFKKSCDKYSISIVLVLDGKRNPAKKDTNVLRDTIRKRNLQKLEELLINGDYDDADEVLRIQKSTMYITEDMLLAVKIWAIKNGVRCIQSLYEADAGLQHLEDMGLTDGTFSEDGDFFALGSKLWATKVSIARGSMMLFNSVRIREAIKERIMKDSDIVMTADHGRVLCVLLGCDFLDRPKGYGPKTVETFLSQWMRSTDDDRLTMLEKIEKGNEKKRKKNEDITAVGYPGYSKKFWLAFNMLKHPPVFHFVSFDDSDLVSIGLLGKGKETIAPEVVFGLLGFHALEGLEYLGNLRNLLFLENNIFIRTMSPLLPLVQPRNDSGALLPWGYHHCFEKWPSIMCTPDMLNRWLRSRSVRYSHAILVNAVNTLLKEVPLRDISPVDDIPDEADLDVGAGGVIWNLDGDSNFNDVRDITYTPTVDKSFITAIFGHRGGVENRAMRLIKGGHFDLSTLKSCKIKCRLDLNMISCIMYQIQSTPSMKTNAYAVNLIFSELGEGRNEIGSRYIRTPYSHCDCPAGQMFCSHMLGFLGILRIIQENKLLSYAAAIAMLPESVKALSSTGILLEYVKFGR